MFKNRSTAVCCLAFSVSLWVGCSGESGEEDSTRSESQTSSPGASAEITAPETSESDPTGAGTGFSANDSGTPDTDTDSDSDADTEPLPIERLAAEVRRGEREVPSAFSFDEQDVERVRVEGEIDEVAPYHIGNNRETLDAENQPELKLRTGQAKAFGVEEQLITCRFDSAEPLLDLIAGQTVILEGQLSKDSTFSGLTSFSLTKCRLIGKDPLPEATIPVRRALTSEEVVALENIPEDLSKAFDDALGVYDLNNYSQSDLEFELMIFPGTLDENGRLPAAALKAIERLPMIDTLQLGRFEPLSNACAADVSRFPCVRELRVWASQLDDAALAELLKIRGLQELFLSHPANVTPAGYAALEHAPFLETLQIFQPVEFGNEAVAHLEHLSRLRRLELDQPTFDDEGLRVLSHLDALREIVLVDAPITGAGLGHLAAPERLWYLSLTSKPGMPVKIDKDLILPLKKMTGLLSLSLSGSNVDATITDALTELPNLRKLDLGETKVDDGLADAIGKLPKLNDVWLKGCPVGDRVLTALAACPKLSQLNLDRTQVTDAGLSAFASRAGEMDLRRFSLVDTKVTEEGLKHLLQLEDLDYLRVSEGVKISDDTVAAFKEKFENFRLSRD